jgi:hypothetical protein
MMQVIGVTKLRKEFQYVTAWHLIVFVKYNLIALVSPCIAANTRTG